MAVSPQMKSGSWENNGFTAEWTLTNPNLLENDTLIYAFENEFTIEFWMSPTQPPWALQLNIYFGMFNRKHH